MGRSLRSLRTGLCGALLAACAQGAIAPAPCAQDQAFYNGECRPAPTCDPGCFPEAIMCRDRPVLRHYGAPWAKFLDQEHKEIPLYNKRLDRGGLDQQHLTYFPDLDLTIGTRLSPSWNGIFWNVDLFIDEGSDRTLDRVYGFNISLLSGARLLADELSTIIAAAKAERDPLSYLYGRLEKFTGDKKVPITREHRDLYSAMLADLSRQMCEPAVR